MSSRMNLASKLAFLERAAEVKRESGKGILAQTREAAALRLGPGKVSGAEYHAYELWDDRRLERRDRETFLGGRIHPRLQRELNDWEWYGVTGHKLAFERYMNGAGLPVPTTLAAVSPTPTPSAGHPVLHRVAHVADYLEAAEYPLFVKPIVGLLGRRASALEGFDPETKEVVTNPGGRITAGRLARRLLDSEPLGYVVQERLPPHGELREVCGEALSTLRVVALLDPDGRAEVVRACWRIPAGGNVADNWLDGGSENLLGWVEVGTGQVQEVVGGSDGWRFRRVSRHPDSGVPFEGLVMPHWDAVLEETRRAARAFPPLGLQSWDVAITPEGPLFLELNMESSMLQFPGRPGLGDRRFQEVLERRREYRWRDYGS